MREVEHRHTGGTVLTNKNPQAPRSVLGPLVWCLAPVPPARDHLGVDAREQRRRRRPFSGHDHRHETSSERPLHHKEFNRRFNLGNRSAKRRNHHRWQRIALALRDQRRIGRWQRSGLGRTWWPNEFVDPSDVGSVGEAATQLGEANF
jgi:hypothetical protein